MFRTKEKKKIIVEPGQNVSLEGINGRENKESKPKSGLNDIANGDQNINDMINNDDNDHTLENKSEEDINSFTSTEKMTI